MYTVKRSAKTMKSQRAYRASRSLSKRVSMDGEAVPNGRTGKGKGGKTPGPTPPSKRSKAKPGQVCTGRFNQCLRRGQSWALS